MVRHIPIIMLATALFCFSLQHTANSSEPVLLQYKFSKMEPLKYRIYKANTTKAVNPFRSVNTSKKQTSDSLVTLLGENNLNEFNLLYENKRLEIESINPEGKFIYDSDHLEKTTKGVLANRMVPMSKAWSNAEFRVTLSPTGQIRKVDGASEFVKKLNSGSSETDSALLGMMKKNSLLLFKEMFPEFPAYPLKINDSWETEFSISLGPYGDGRGTKNYTYKGLTELNGKKCLLISVEYDMVAEVNLDLGATQLSGKYKLLKSSGTVHFEPKQGQLLAIKSEYTMSGELMAQKAGKKILINSSTDHVYEVKLISH